METMKLKKPLEIFDAILYKNLQKRIVNASLASRTAELL